MVIKFSHTHSSFTGIEDCPFTYDWVPRTSIVRSVGAGFCDLIDEDAVYNHEFCNKLAGVRIDPNFKAVTHRIIFQSQFPKSEAEQGNIITQLPEKYPVPLMAVPLRHALSIHDFLNQYDKDLSRFLKNSLKNFSLHNSMAPIDTYPGYAR